MKRIYFTFIKIKEMIIPFLFCIFILFLIIFSKSNIASSKSGLTLWANTIVPSLLPFFVATELLSHTSVISFFGKHLKHIMKPIFNVPGESAFAFIMGILSGYPIGAKIVSNFYENNICSRAEAERLIAFTNNSGPLFIIGTVRYCYVW